MTEIEIDGERIFINGKVITSNNNQLRKIVAGLYMPDGIPRYEPEYVIAISAVNTLGAKIISGDALTTLAPKKGNLY